ncbi:MAG: hypothetical protein C7N36_02950 [Bacteroidetes bacterium]|nr:MAG: hypothetical protein C7N36_02950 [Bacteroidota bacterium]
MLLSGLCCTALWASGQRTNSFQYLSKKDGLSQASVFAIAQDSTGLMWFGTRDGLNKYDGYQFKVYRNAPTANSLVDNDIRTLYVDPQQQKLWIGTISGLSQYEATTDDFTNYRHSPTDTTSLSSDVIRQIYRDSRGRLWVGTSAGLNLYHHPGKFRRFFFAAPQASTLEHQDIETIVEDAQGQVWFGTANGLYQLIVHSAGTYQFERRDGRGGCQLADARIKSLLADRKGNLWIGTFSGGLHYWDQKNDTVTVYQSKKNTANTLSHNNIRSMCLDGADNLWIGTFDGLNFFDQQRQTFTRYDKAVLGTAGLSDNSVRAVFIDKRGSLWLGTYYGGINHFDENYNRFTNFKHTPLGNTLSEDVVSSFAEDDAGNLWIGTEGGGLNYYDRQRQHFSSYQAQVGQAGTLSGDNVKEVFLDGDQLWVGTFQAGLNLFDLKTKRFQHFVSEPDNPNSLPNNNVYGLRKENNRLWILTYGGGLAILDLTAHQFYTYQHQAHDSTSLSSNLTRVFLETADQQLWIGTERGVNKVTKNAAGFPVGFAVFLPHEKIYTLQEDFQHHLWIGTISNGLYCLHPATGQLEHYTTADGLPGNTVFGVLEVAPNELWLSTNNGLAKFNPSQKTFTNYNYANGLGNLEYNFNAYYKTRAGELLFGGINGFTLFDPQTIQPNTFIPPVVFTELRKNNNIVEIHEESSCLTKSINETESITFKYNEANFTINFAALDYFSPENNHYAFKLEGLDRDWKYNVGKTAATYTIQREGRYVFRLRGANSDGVWNPQERQLEVIVLPPPWRTWWAYLLYLAALAGVIYSLVRFVRLRHSLQLQQIAKQQQEELHEVKLRFFTNITHEFRTPLTLILGPLKDLLAKKNHAEGVHQQLSLIERNAQRLLNLVNQVLTFRKLMTDHEPLKIVPGDIGLFLHEIFLSFQETAQLRKIDYSFQVSPAEIKAWYDPDKLEKVFFNLLANAFNFTPDGGQIALRIAQLDTYIEVRVEDNGPGIDPELQEQIFKRFYEKSDTARSTIKGTGIGLAISKQMVELHQGKIFVAHTVVQPGVMPGATFVVQIPCGSTHFPAEVVLCDFPDQEKIAAYQPLLVPALHLDQRLPPAPKPVAATAPLLLIVEDNTEVAAYIRQIFAGEYRLIMAQNGVEGLQKAKKKLPDLIISDVMMPEMDGITFCGKLKADFEISHIPIMLLTARTASLFKIEGLKTGADDYLTKPFNPEELRLRVHNIIQSRQDARNKFARVIAFDPKEINITSADEYFLENALGIVEKHMDDYVFNIEQFALELAVSRPLLFTKLKALTGQTPNNFIKTIRLKRAAQLLKTQKLNVSEVAYKVGFKDPKYFRKCFIEQFEVLPSVFSKS